TRLWSCAMTSGRSADKALERGRRSVRLDLGLYAGVLMGEFRAAELALQFVEPIAVGREPAADERAAQAEVLLALGPPSGDPFRLVGESGEFVDLRPKVPEASEDRGVVEEVARQEAQLRLVPCARERGRLRQPLDEHVASLRGEAVDRALGAPFAGLTAGADVAELLEPLRLRVHLARRRRPVEVAASTDHVDDVARRRPALADQGKQDVGQRSEVVA